MYLFLDSQWDTISITQLINLYKWVTYHNTTFQWDVLNIGI